MITVRYFAGAAETAGVETETLFGNMRTLAELREELVSRHGPGFSRVLGYCAVLVDGVCLDDSGSVKPGSTVDILPPFAGG